MVRADWGNCQQIKVTAGKPSSLVWFWGVAECLPEVYSGVFRQLPGTEGRGKWGYKGRRPLKASRDPKEGWRQLPCGWRRADLAQGLQS